VRKGASNELTGVSNRSKNFFAYSIDRRISDLFYLDALGLSAAGFVPAGGLQKKVSPLMGTFPAL